jgi:hypothetical protein
LNYLLILARRSLAPQRKTLAPGLLWKSSRIAEPGFSIAGVYDFSAMLGDQANQQWISQYAASHQHPVNRACHTLGIPAILLSMVFLLAALFVHGLWLYAAVLFALGWALQFVGHAFEGKPPEFLSNWRFLLVGVRWWWAKIHGKA